VYSAKSSQQELLAILPGKRLGTHEILLAIGVGGMVEVYKARASDCNLMTGSGKENDIHKTLLNIMIWLFFLGGLFGFVMGMSKFLREGTPAEYGVMGIGGGFWLLCSAITIYIRDRLQ